MKIAHLSAGLAALVLTAGLAACGGAAANPSAGPAHDTSSGQTVTGQVKLEGAGVWETSDGADNAGETCTSNDQHQLVVTNQSGTVLGQTVLGDGSVIKDDSDPGYPSYSCGISYTVPIKKADQYGFSIDGTTPNYVSSQQLVAAGYSESFAFVPAGR